MKSMRKLLIALLLLLGCAFLFSRITDLQQVAETLRKGDWRWLLFALAIQLAYVVNTGASFWAIYRLLGMNEKIERLTLLAQAANFVIVIAPSAGMGGIAVFAADARKRGHSTGRVTTAAALFVLYDYLATLIVVLMGLLVLFRRDKLHASEISAAVFILLLAIALASLLYLGMQSGEKLAAALAWIGSRINRVLGIFTKRKQLDLESARNFALDAAEGLVQARRSPDGLLLPFALAMSNKALMMAILFLMFLAFGQPFSIGTLVAGYAVGYLFTIVSPTPSGIGFVETAMTLGLNSLRVPLAPAALIVLGYRAYTLWLPFLYGMLAIRWVGRSSEEDPAQGCAQAQVDPSPSSIPSSQDPAP